MRRHMWIGALVVALLAAGRGRCAEPTCGGPPLDSILKQWGPVGGWHPYGGGLLSWWPRNCFPRCGAPDDYCRKPLPRVCWPPYPPYYIWGPPEVCCPQGNGCRDCNRPH
jgi:hypothetical protein